MMMRLCSSLGMIFADLMKMSPMRCIKFIDPVVYNHQQVAV